MASLAEFQNSGVRFHPDYLDEGTVAAMLAGFQVPEVAAPEPYALPLNKLLGASEGVDAAFEQAWSWMRDDPEVAQALSKSNMTKEQIFAEIKKRLDGPVDKDLHDAAVRFANRPMHEVVEEDGKIVHKLQGVPVLEIGMTEMVGASPKVMLIVALVLDILALVFAAFSIRAGFNVDKVTNRIVPLVERGGGEVSTRIAEAAKTLEELEADIRRGKNLEKACEAVAVGMAGISNLIKEAAKTALKTMSWGDWAIAVGSLLVSIALILVTGGAALVAKIAGVMISFISVVVDIIALV